MSGPEGKGDPGPEEEELERSQLRQQVQFLREEAAVLRRRLGDPPPRQVRMLEEQLLETKGQLARALSQNERLAATLREAREQIAALQDEVERLRMPVPDSFDSVLDDLGDRDQAPAPPAARRRSASSFSAFLDSLSDLGAAT